MIMFPVASRAPCRAGPSSREPATAARLHLPRSARRVGGTCGGRNESVTRPFAALRRNRARGLCLSVHRSLHSPRVPRSFRPRSEGPFPPSVTSFPSLPCPVVSLATRDPTPLPSHHPSSGLGNGPRSPSSWRRFLLSSRTALARRCSPPPYGRGSPRPAALYGENERRG